MKTGRSLLFAVAFAVGLTACGTDRGRVADNVAFKAHDLSGWKQPTGDWLVAKSISLAATNETRFAIKQGAGIFVNGENGKTAHLVTEAEFGDAEVHIEFCLAKKSNSGVFLMGRYETQI